MGYYTRYELSVQEDTFTGNDWEEIVSGYTDYGPFGQECKWYDHEQDMIRVSKDYPEVLFILRGEGEEAGDLWISYFKNGKYQRHEAIITYPEYNELLMKE